MVQDKYSKLASGLKAILPSRQIFSSPLYRLAKGTDASFYRLLPQLVVQVNNEEEVQSVLELCVENAVPVTFKAGGTSLSGQTITESVLIELGPAFNKYSIKADGALASFQPGITGAFANALLSKYNRKIGPSPASINAAKIGGIVANNASGASYGIATNSYNTLRGMRIVFLDGSILDTRDFESRAEFLTTHPNLVDGIKKIRGKILANPVLEAKIRSKFELKNTCGYGVNSLVDFEDPIDCIAHLMIGSEGTLGFISEVTFATVDDYPLKACSLLYFKDIRTATEAILPLRECKVSAAELMDRKALRSVENNAGMPPVIKELDNFAAALLIETSAPTEALLLSQMEEIKNRLAHIQKLFPIEFTCDPKEFQKIWKVRKGLFTSAAAARPKGTACLIEDVAFPGEVLGDALTDLQDLLYRHDYQNAVIWGHLLDGNIHFLISPDFQQSKHMDNYKLFMHGLAELVVEKYNGSLKAEHGTGRNMAPFVKYEWGDEIYGIMKEIKALFDPDNLLNPGVLINEDLEVFAKNIKPFPVTHPLVDDCIECGFCERNCPSREFTLTPRQRIAAYREITRLVTNGKSKEVEKIAADYNFHGEESCATDGLCALDCPVGINTGKLIKELRYTKKSSFANGIASFLANHFGGAIVVIRFMLKVVGLVQKIIPVPVMKGMGSFLHKISGRTIPLWNEYMPQAAPVVKPQAQVSDSINNTLKVVYFPACINRIFGVSRDYDEKVALTRKTETVIRRAGYQIIYPEKLKSLCCGMAFDSKGFKDQGMVKLKELEAALLKASENGKYPVVCDMSPCLLRMKEGMDKRLKLYEPVEFTLTCLADKLTLKKLPISVSVHSTCSTTKMGLEDQLVKLAGLCAEKVVKPEKTGCCGWAGDKGFNLPELNTSALKYLKEELPAGLEGGYSNSRTCEIGLTLHSGISYKSVIYLVDKATV